VLDFEDPLLSPGAAFEWLNQVALWVGRAPIIYSDPAVIKHVLGSIPASFVTMPLWIAEYGISVPKISPWGKWTFWQYENGGSIPGITTPVDLDWFNGSLEDLQAFIGLSS
jgi:lysozyme